MRKDMIELKRNLNDEVREKELFSKTNEDLRGTVKKNEVEKTELSRDLCDHRQKCSSKYDISLSQEPLNSQLLYNIKERIFLWRTCYMLFLIFQYSLGGAEGKCSEGGC